MTTTELKDIISKLCAWHEQLEQGPSGPEWFDECKACSSALNALVGIRTQRQLEYARQREQQERADQQAYADDLIAQQEGVEVVADWD